MLLGSCMQQTVAALSSFPQMSDTRFLRIHSTLPRAPVYHSARIVSCSLCYFAGFLRCTLSLHFCFKIDLWLLSVWPCVWPSLRRFVCSPLPLAIEHYLYYYLFSLGLSLYSWWCVCSFLFFYVPFCFSLSLSLSSAPMMLFLLHWWFVFSYLTLLLFFADQVTTANGSQ